jgi:hypothetical protein
VKGFVLGYVIFRRMLIVIGKVPRENDFKSIPLFSIKLKLLEQIPHCLFQDFTRLN